jgi:isoquinoline 1-oxidoreductase beta subunit
MKPLNLLFNTQKNKLMENRRDFLKKAFLSTGSLILGFGINESFAGVSTLKNIEEASLFNAYLTINSTGKIKLFSPNPEIGQGIKTAFAVIIAEELDVDISEVEVVQAHFDPTRFDRQETGGSGAIRHSWERLRKAGASARYALVQAAAQKWGVSADTLKTDNGKVIGQNGKVAIYQELVAEASKIQIPEKITLKSTESFKQIGKNIKGIDNQEVITGRAIYGIDYFEEGMVYAQMIRPPFGKKLDRFDASEAKKIEGISDVLAVGDKVAIVGNSTWQVMKARKLIDVIWKSDKPIEDDNFHNKIFDDTMNNGKFDIKRSNGNIEMAFKEASQIVEATYQGPFLPHNSMEPMNFFADARNLNSVRLVGPMQNPVRTRPLISKLLGTPAENISIQLTKMGGAFGRRIAPDFSLEAAELSKVIQKPVKLYWTREDDMTGGYYRPAVRYKFKAAIDKNKNITAYSLKGIGMSWNNVVRENNFPVGAIENILIENFEYKSDITTGYWRAPITNFLAFAEQAFLDEVATKIGKDPIQLRLDLLKIVKEKGIKNLTYDPQRFEEVIKKVAERANWGKKPKGVFQGFSVYFSHNSYVAQIAEVVLEKSKPALKKVYAVVDCGIVVNMSGAKNQVYGSIVDGLGHALFGKLSFEDGLPQENNFNSFRLIRFNEVPEIDVHFIENGISPTGLGEPALPPVGGALANAFAKATKKRLYIQPFADQNEHIKDIL